MTIAPESLREFDHEGIAFKVYASAADMGAASAVRIAERQIDLAARQDAVGILLMAAPSAFPFYAAYLNLAEESADLRDALTRTHVFQFDDYPLPADHPASFRHLLETHFFGPLRERASVGGIHPLNVDGPDPERVCTEYASEVLRFGPDLQLKGVGENGHWGFHEPGIPLDGDPAYIRVDLSEENVAQQLRDHPDVFRDPEDVPREAYTANVPLFLRTRDGIEDNVPQASKAFALLAAYGSSAVNEAVPSSALKRHHNATVRTTAEAAWALEAYLERGAVTRGDIRRMAESLTGEGSTAIEDTAAHLAVVLNRMGVRMDD